MHRPQSTYLRELTDLVAILQRCERTPLSTGFQHLGGLHQFCYVDCIHDAGVTVSAGCDPRIMGIGPVSAVHGLLTATGKNLQDIDLIEVPESL